MFLPKITTASSTRAMNMRFQEESITTVYFRYRRNRPTTIGLIPKKNTMVSMSYFGKLRNNSLFYYRSVWRAKLPIHHQRFRSISHRAFPIVWILTVEWHLQWQRSSCRWVARIIVSLTGGQHLRQHLQSQSSGKQKYGPRPLWLRLSLFIRLLRHVLWLPCTLWSQSLRRY